MTSKYFLTAIGLIIITAGILLSQNWSVQAPTEEIVVNTETENQNSDFNNGHDTNNNVASTSTNSFATSSEETDSDLEEKIVGTYISDLLPAASSPGREYKLTLGIDSDSNKSVLFVADYKNNEAVINQNGTWRLDEVSGRVNVIVLIDNVDGEKINPPKEYRFVFEENSSGKINILNSSVLDVAMWGSMGLRLERQN